MLAIIQKALRLRRQEGFTIVEMMVVVTILGILATVSATLVSILFTANLRSSQLGSQQTTITSAFGFLSSRLSLAQYNEIGIAEGTSVQPLSVAGDQLVFTSLFDSTSSASGGGRVCYRVMYLAELEELRVASEPGGCASASTPNIVPRRGPNAYLFSGGNAYRMPGDTNFDPALDSAYPQVQDYCEANSSNADCQKIEDLSPWTLAEGIKLQDLSAGEISRIPAVQQSVVQGNSEKLAPFFGYIKQKEGGAQISFNAGGGSTFSPSLVAGVAGGNYNVSPSGEIGGVAAQAFVMPFGSDVQAQSKVSPRYYRQEYSFQQACALDYNVPGTDAGGDLSGAFPNPTLKNNSIEFENFSQNAFPGITVGVTSNVTVQNNTLSNLITYPAGANSSDVPAGRYLLFASINASAATGNSELSLWRGNNVIASTSTNKWPMALSGISEFNPGANDKIYLKVKASETSIPASASNPIRLQLQWLGPIGSDVTP